MPANSLGARIRLARDRLGLSQQELADRLHVDRKSVHNWEHDLKAPLRSHLVMLEEVLGPLRGDPDDAFTLAGAIGLIRDSDVFTGPQKQALLRQLGQQPHIRNPALIPAPAK